LCGPKLDADDHGIKVVLVLGIWSANMFWMPASSRIWNYLSSCPDVEFSSTILRLFYDYGWWNNNPMHHNSLLNTVPNNRLITYLWLRFWRTPPKQWEVRNCHFQASLSEEISSLTAIVTRWWKTDFISMRNIIVFCQQSRRRSTLQSGDGLSRSRSAQTTTIIV